MDLLREMGRGSCSLFQQVIIRSFRNRPIARALRVTDGNGGGDLLTFNQASLSDASLGGANFTQRG